MSFRMTKTTVPAGLAEELTPSSWCHSRGKRGLDVVLATACLVASLPLLLVAAVLVKATSRGPILFRHQRTGLKGKAFQLLKFRTMYHQSAGPNVTRAGDSRITPVGRFLRRTKLDELPQFLNVLKGEMSVIGPRPDAPQFWATSLETDKRVLQLLPGVTGAATLTFHDEEKLLGQVPAQELQEFYINTLMPEKARRDLAYAARASLRRDLQILWRTFLRLIPHFSPRPLSFAERFHDLSR